MSALSVRRSSGRFEFWAASALWAASVADSGQPLDAQRRACSSRSRPVSTSRRSSGASSRARPASSRAAAAASWRSRRPGGRRAPPPQPTRAPAAGDLGLARRGAATEALSSSGSAQASSRLPGPPGQPRGLLEAIARTLHVGEGGGRAARRVGHPLGGPRRRQRRRTLAARRRQRRAGRRLDPLKQQSRRRAAAAASAATASTRADGSSSTSAGLVEADSDLPGERDHGGSSAARGAHPRPQPRRMQKAFTAPRHPPSTTLEDFLAGLATTIDQAPADASDARRKPPSKSDTPQKRSLNHRLQQLGVL